MVVCSPVGPLRLGGPHARTILAALTLDAGRRVPLDRMVDLLWEERPALTARKAAQVYVWQLRRLLDKVPDSRIHTEPGGYQRLTKDPREWRPGCPATPVRGRRGSADGAEAVAAVRRLRPDVVLIDIRMPNVDGLEAA